MMLAQTEPPTWTATLSVLAMLAGGLGLLCTGLMVFYMKRQTDLMAAANARPQIISPQPLAVELVEELHEQFASKRLFDDHVKNNTERHGQIFSRIDRVEREAREQMEKRFTALNEERKETLEKLNEQFTFIRENVSEIKTELRIRNE